MQNSINLVVASDDNYAQHAAITLLSAYDNCSEPQYLQCHILDGGISPEKKEKIISSLAPYDSQVNFIQMDATRFKQLYTSFQYTSAIYYRLDLPNVLSSTIEKCIYVDCDLLFLDDIVKLWKINLQGHPMGAVEDLGLMTSKKGLAGKAKSLGLTSNDKYFNSGVVVMDLEAWRKNDYSRQAIELASKHDFQSHDQDVLNKLFLGNWQEMDLRWNIIPPITYLYPKIIFSSYCKEAIRARNNPGILHYAGRYKAWEFAQHKNFNAYYYELLQKSAFKNVPMPQLSKQNIGRNFTKELLRLKLADWLSRIL